MSTSKTRWFDRAFAFDDPPWMARNLLARLRGTPARVEELTAGLAPGALTTHRGEAWSIQEHVGHLLDLEPLWLGRVDDVFEGAEVMRPADLQNTKTHEANHDATPLAELHAAFRAERARFVERLQDLGDADFERAAKHPRLDQPMRLLDLMLFVAEHDDHHLADMAELRGRV